MASSERVAVIGLGSSGIVAVKNLREVGFDVVGFEKNDYIGGLWRFTTDQETLSVTQQTRANISRQKFAYTDFGWPPDVSDYPLASEVATYIDDYATKFDLLKHCRLGVNVQSIEKASDGPSWDVTTADRSGKSTTERYSRVVITTGPQARPLMPTLQGSECFRGRIMHSIAFKDPEDFAKQKAIVVGVSNTACDIAVELADHASEVYLCHRAGARLVERNPPGIRPTDHLVTRRGTTVVQALSRLVPSFMSRLGELALELQMKYKLKVDKAWNLLPAGPISNVAPVANDHIISLLRSKRVTSLPSISHISPDSTVHLHSWDTTSPLPTTLKDINTIIFCTGYDSSFTYLSPTHSPTFTQPNTWSTHPNNNGLLYPRLYRGIFTPHDTTIAFPLGYRGPTLSSLTNSDLASQAIAQIWVGNYTLPTNEQMSAWCDTHFARVLRLLDRYRMVQIPSDPPGHAGEYEKWLNDVAGNGVNEYLGSWTSWRGWVWMLSNLGLWNKVMGDVDTPFVYRLFESPRGGKGRRKWDGAEAAIRRAGDKRRWSGKAVSKERVTGQAQSVAKDSDE